MADFAKYHAMGNDYLVIDPHRIDLAPTAEAARLLCDRHRGIGADGVLFGPAGPVSPALPVELRVFNSDGSVCERSGNGIRLFALYLAEHYRTPGAEDGRLDYTVRTIAGANAIDSAVRVCDLDAGIVRIEMGRPSFDAADVPVLDLTGTALRWPLDVDGRTWTVTTLNNGNPHVVVLLDQISAELAHEIGEPIAGHRRFPTRANVQLARVIDRARLELEIWERGAGYTLASGSSACAAASAAHALGLVDGTVTVAMPGGAVEIQIADDGTVTMTGSVAAVATGRFAPALRHRLGLPR